MPCYDPRSDNVRVEYRDDPRKQEYIEKLNAALCAIISELDKRGITNDVISNASREGLIDLMTWWDAHAKSDETRLALELHKYSVQEQDVLRKLLSKDK